MEAVGRKWRVGVVLGVLGVLALVGLALHPQADLPHVSSAPVSRPVAEPIVDLGRLYDLDHLVLDGDPVLQLDRMAPVGAGPNRSSAVPEPAPATLWILGLAALYALYLPARSW